jgi:uncharacterized membrane protein YeaQ/YmgE (transglycosylase-associated protein family)
MSWLAFIILTVVWGLIIGAFARLALPGPDPLTIPQTILLGIAGSMIGGIVVYLITGGRYYGAGFLGSLVCSVVILYFIRRSRGGSLTDPGRGPQRRP